MHASLSFSDLDPRKDDYATRVVERLLRAAMAAGASDIHLDASASEVIVRWRVAGVLLAVAEIREGVTTRIIARIKAMARLVTYRHDIPQEGRLQLEDRTLEARVGTLPTPHGERAVIRLVTKQTQAWFPEDLGLPPDALRGLQQGLQRASGVLLVSGTAGAGKTTTAYAVLRAVLGQIHMPRSVVSLEDPIETEIAGAAQSQINPAVGYDWNHGLKAILRQDPEVMLVGEIREAETAGVVFQAAMAGQLVISTMHARSVADAVRRLLDMQVPAHHLRSALNVLICQRLVRGLCAHCGGSGAAVACSTQSGPHADQACPMCLGSGSSGRTLLAEILPSIEGEMARAMLQDADTKALMSTAQSLGMRSLATLAEDAIASGRMRACDSSRHFIE